MAVFVQLERRGRSIGGLSLALLFLPGLAIPLLAGTIAASGRFDGLYGQDAFAYYDYAVGPLRQSLTRLEPFPDFFWPPGYPILVSLIALLVGTTPLAGQVASLLAGSLVPLFTALLAREVWRTQHGSTGISVLHVPLVAAALVAFNGQLWQSSVVIMADTLGLATATLGVWALARYDRLGKPVWLVVAGIALAWAILTRWAYALVAIPCAVFALVALRRQPLRVAVTHSAPAIFVVFLILAPVLLSLGAGLLRGTGDSSVFAGDLHVYTWHPLNALAREFVTIDGVLRYALPNGLYYAAAPAHWAFFTPLLAPLILPGLWAIARRRGAAALLLIAGWAIIVYAFHAGAPWQNFRFTLAYLPPLAILAAIGWTEVRKTVRHRGWALASILLLAAGLIWMASGGVRLTQQFVERKQDNLETVRWVEASSTPDALLLTFNMTATFRHYSHLNTLELYELEPAELAGLIAEQRPLLLFIDVPNVEEQWAGRPPSENYRWLRDGPGLTSLGQRGPYTLFRAEENGP